MMPLPLPPPYRLVAHDLLDSTNDEAKRLAQSGLPAWTLIWARRQSAGRGRRQRGWVSVPGNLYVSSIHRPAVEVAAATQLGFVAALAARDALTPFLPKSAELRIKWPNDILVNGRKIGGVLLESATGKNGNIEWLVIGVGINVASYPDGMHYEATSLAAIGPAPPAVEAVLERYASALLDWESRWCREGFAPVRTAWLDRAFNRGGEVTVRLDRESFSGRFTDIDESGALLVDTDTGRRRVTVGDVFPISG